MAHIVVVMVAVQWINSPQEICSFLRYSPSLLKISFLSPPLTTIYAYNQAHKQWEVLNMSFRCFM